MLIGIKKIIPIQRFVKETKKLAEIKYKKSEYIINPQILKRIPVYRNNKIIDTLPFTIRNEKIGNNSIIKYDSSKTL
jgi:hypothetical protein